MPGYYDETEIVFLIGKLLPGEAVKIKLIGIPGDILFLLFDDTCIESVHAPGFYVWDTTNIDFAGMSDPSPSSPSPFSPAGFALAFPMTVLYVMEDSKGNQHAGKFIVGAFPEQVRRTYSNVQTLL